MDLLGSSIPGDVGLRLLLTPICSNIVIRTACCTVGTVLPVYSTFKSIESNDQEEREKWLVYWAAHGTFSLLEVFSDKLISWVPFYYHVKFAFLLWLQLPSNNGASHLYRRHIRPFLLKHQYKFDLLLNYTSGETIKFLVAHEIEIQCLKDLIMKGARTANQMLKDFRLFQFQGGEGPNAPTSSHWSINLPSPLTPTCPVHKKHLR
ncbi:HVA22-like protein k isoform X2 [Phalaenopsis equestris]|uniref:HVA22-like protein k isoform X2 n=1 Tax=Phalaenopsis equestris TaxID=78828 RepID=UPI0009E5A905|nr:HVA22-like protein k isoform X2 [Phalaenopsis equestris]